MKINALLKMIQNIMYYMKKYEILEIPYIYTIKTNINDYAELIKYNDYKLNFSK